ncbi:hypothetical protein Tco_0619481 [Tanacetum coccineum]
MFSYLSHNPIPFSSHQGSGTDWLASSRAEKATQGQSNEWGTRNWRVWYEQSTRISPTNSSSFAKKKLSHIIYEKMKERHLDIVARLEEHGFTYIKVAGCHTS